MCLNHLNIIIGPKINYAINILTYAKLLGNTTKFPVFNIIVSLVRCT